MDVQRRDFIKGLATALVLPDSASASICEIANNAPTRSVDSRIEKTIKASFGGGFSVQAHAQSSGLTYAAIEHFGNRYVVTSTDLLDWKIVGSTLGNPNFVSPFASIESHSMA